MYAPSEIDSNIIIQYENRLVNTTATIYKDMNTTLQAYKTAANASALTRLSNADWNALNTNIKYQSGNVTTLSDPKKTQSGTHPCLSFELTLLMSACLPRTRFGGKFKFVLIFAVCCLQLTPRSCWPS